jgi:flagellin-like hook-associated protein FlgL
MVMQTSSALNRTSRRISDSLLRLSTGNRLAKAETDSASFSIAAKIRSRLAGLNQALQNVSDAKGMLDVAEQNLVQINERLMTIRQAVIKASSATPGTIERSFIRDQINGLGQEINALVGQAQYAGIPLLDGSLDSQFQVGEQAGSTLSLTLDKDITVEDLVVEEISSEGALTGASLNSSTNINDVDQFEGIQAGDTFDIVITKGDGTDVTIGITAAGSKGQLTSTTFGDIVTAINNEGTFQASFDGGAIKITQVDNPDGNNLALRFNNFTEFPGTDGASSSLAFNFDASKGVLVSNFTTGGVTSGTTLNSINEFSNLEGQDSLSINVTTRDGTTVNTSITLPGAEGTTSNYTAGDLVNDLQASFTAQGVDLTASLTGGQIEIQETDLAQFSLSASSSFTENNLDAGAASVSLVSFQSITKNVVNTDLDAITGASALSGTTVQANNNLVIGENLSDGDTFDILLTGNDGSTETINYTYNAGDTFSDLVTAIDGSSSFDAYINGSNELVVEELQPTLGGSLNVQLTNLNSGTGSLVNTTFGAGTQQVVSSESLWTPDSGTDFDTTTTLEQLDGFTNVQAGDTLDIQLRSGTGAVYDFTYTFGGDLGTTSDDTVQDLMTAIQNQSDGSANFVTSFDTTNNAIIVEDTINPNGGGLTLSFTNYTEQAYPNNASTPSPPLSFSYNTSIDGMESQQLTVSGAAANSGTQLNQLDGFSNIEDGDQLQVTVTNRAGSSQTLTLNFDNLSTGQSSTETVGDLVNLIDGTTIGGVQMSATLNNGRIEITEDNPPQVGGFDASTGFTENNIDKTPKTFTNVQFNISDFLRVSDSTGLVIGLGFVDFSDQTDLTPEISRIMLENIDDSINRVISTINQIGTFQTRLSNREINLQSSIINNEQVKSRIQDVDYAKEYSRLVQNQILRQYQILSQAQANLAPSNVLSLL